MSRTRVIVAVIVGASLLVGVAACSDDDPALPSARRSATTSTPSTTTTTVVGGDAGSPGIGDPATPFAGNGGYDVAHYRLEIDATRPNGEIVGTTTIDATATHALSSFDLDLAGFTVDDVTVDGTDAPEGRFGPELRVTPGRAIAEGATFTTVVRYHGVPEPVPDPTAPGEIGWLTGASGSFVLSEPVGAKGVFPSNDHPSDKATYTIVVTAPTTDTVVANGVRTDRVEGGAATTWTFDMPDPMATYLVQIAIGQYRIVEGTTPAGLPLRSAAPSARPAIDLTAANQRAADQIAFFQTLFGPYPFDNYGILIADAPPTFALETQTISTFPTSWYLVGELVSTETLEAHELSHQWFGDSVSLDRWNDIWLNEGFATYAEWLWDDHTGKRSVDAAVAEVMPEAPSMRQQYGAVAEPAKEDLFSPNEYDGAGIVLHALRKTIGDDKFFTTLRTWTERYGGTTVNSAEFEALAAEVSGQDLTSFFAEWLHSTTVPPMPA